MTFIILQSLRTVGYLWLLFMFPEAVGDFRMLGFHCGAVANLSLSTWVGVGQGCINLSLGPC